jgi:NADH-quinone oxidoreductase subunit I
MDNKPVEKDLNSSRQAPLQSEYVPPNDYSLKGVFKGIMSLIDGMSLTFSYLINPKKVVTQQYPENRETLKMTKRFRGQVIMPHDEQGEHKCTGCTLCDKACPNGTISVLNKTNLKGKKVLGKYIYRLDQCTLCNLCIEACPFDAIRMGGEFEFSTENKEDLTLTLNKKEGRC